MTMAATCFSKLQDQIARMLQNVLCAKLGLRHTPGLFAKFKIWRYKFLAVSTNLPNILLAKFSRYTVHTYSILMMTSLYSPIFSSHRVRDVTFVPHTHKRTQTKLKFMY